MVRWGGIRCCRGWYYKRYYNYSLRPEKSCLLLAQTNAIRDKTPCKLQHGSHNTNILTSYIVMSQTTHDGAWAESRHHTVDSSVNSWAYLRLINSNIFISPSFLSNLSVMSTLAGDATKQHQVSAHFSPPRGENGNKDYVADLRVAGVRDRGSPELWREWEKDWGELVKGAENGWQAEQEVLSSLVATKLPQLDDDVVKVHGSLSACLPDCIVEY